MPVQGDTKAVGTCARLNMRQQTITRLLACLLFMNILYPLDDVDDDPPFPVYRTPLLAELKTRRHLQASCGWMEGNLKIPRGPFNLQYNERCGLQHTIVNKRSRVSCLSWLPAFRLQCIFDEHIESLSD